MVSDTSLFARLGGAPTLQKVHRIFYDKVYAHPWLKQYFTDKPQEILEKQQTAFMTQVFGGPQIYAGKTPKFAHQHMLISDDLFNLRNQMLEESLIEAGIEAGLRQEWLNFDATFRPALVKRSETECTRAYADQDILNFRRPA